MPMGPPDFSRAQAFLLILMAANLSGCTLYQMSQHIDQQKVDIVDQQATLGELQRTNSALAAQTARLNIDLQHRQLNAGELHSRLDNLLQLNAVAQAKSAEEQAKKDERQRRLKAVTAQARALEQDTGPDDTAKRQRLADLQKETARVLQELLSG